MIVGPADPWGNGVRPFQPHHDEGKVRLKGQSQKYDVWIVGAKAQAMAVCVRVYVIRAVRQRGNHLRLHEPGGEMLCLPGCSCLSADSIHLETHYGERSGDQEGTFRLSISHLGMNLRALTETYRHSPDMKC